MILGIILAAGEGTRIQSNGINKTAIALHGKPLIQYGIDLFAGLTDATFIVVGAYANSVKQQAKGENLHFVSQKMRLGTGHAVKVAVEAIEHEAISAKSVLVGYGDHMMRYSKRDIQAMVSTHQQSDATVTLVTTEYDEPDELAWGRIIRNEADLVVNIIEQKDATPQQKQIKELNAGFYCFNWDFLSTQITNLKKSPVSHEYYLTDMIPMAASQGLNVQAFPIPFERVGLGINTQEQFTQMEAHTS
jgi:bifunctional UDP-N-acetylglucosamine pyrophosphorylase / glucosamine-1-phosphate N-acetyltransferase